MEIKNLAGNEVAGHVSLKETPITRKVDEIAATKARYNSIDEDKLETHQAKVINDLCKQQMRELVRLLPPKNIHELVYIRKLCGSRKDYHSALGSNDPCDRLEARVAIHSLQWAEVGEFSPIELVREVN